MASFCRLSSRAGRALLPSAAVPVVVVCPCPGSHKLKRLSWTAEGPPTPSEASRDDLRLFEPCGFSPNPSTTPLLIPSHPHAHLPPKTALITGITGQDGSYLAELLLEKAMR